MVTRIYIFRKATDLIDSLDANADSNESDSADLNNVEKK